ncbi:MAG: GlsB/YeaQ/YmgE family stress response membrane protein [Actinomycetales bacterium]
MHTLGIIIGTIIFGAIIGVLARLVLPGRQRVSVVMTIVIGIIGALLGYWLAGILGVNDTKGIDWIRWVISIAVAAVLVVGFERISASRGAKV